MEHETHIHIHIEGYAPVQPAQVSQEPMESEQDKEYRLMAKYADKEQTLTDEEFEFLKRRGCVRY